MRKPHLALAALLALVTHARTAPSVESAGFARAMANAERSLDSGQLDATFNHLRRALERQPKSVRAWQLRAMWARAAEDRDEEVYALHRAVRLGHAQGIPGDQLEKMEAALAELDPHAARWLGLSEKYVAKLLPLAEKYEKDERRHSAIRVHKEILALNPERADSQAAIERIASAPDPSLAGDAKPKDLLADVSEEFILEHDEEHLEWKNRAKLQKDNYTTQTNAGYEVLVRAAEAMEQMNAFYRIFFRYGTEEHGGNVSRIDLNIFKTRDEYLEMGIGPPVEWSGGHFTGGAVETYIGAGGFEETVGTLFHEAAHQFVSLATSAAGWLNEGLASFFEGCRILPNGTVLMNMPANHRLFPLVTRLEQGWMSDAWDGIDKEDPSAGTPSKAPTFRIVLENEYPWGPPWYAPTWGVVYFLYNYQDPLDGRFVYRKSFGDFINASGGRVGKGAVRNFEEVVLLNPAEPTKGVTVSDDLVLPQTVEELDAVWKDWLIELRDQQTGRLEVERPYVDWARYAIQRKDYQDAAEHFEKGIVATPDDVTLLIDFADLLVEPFEQKDRAAKLLRDAARLVELTEPVDEALLKKVETRIGKLDPTEKTISRIHEELVAEITDIVESYIAEGSNLMAMDVSWRMGNDFGIDSMFEYFREGATRSKKSLALWKLMYNEENLDGWAASAAEIFTPDGEIIRTSFETYEPDNFDYRFLTLEEITSGDFSMEAEIQANKGKVSFGGIVFGRKSQKDFHALLYHPPSTGGAGLERKARLDLASFFGDTSYKTWRQTQVEQKIKADRSSSGEWHKLRIDVTGAVVDGWIDGDYAFTHEFPSLDQLRGRFGLLIGKGGAAFRNVRYLARTPRDPGSLIERELRMEELGDSGTSRGGSWLGLKPPFPKVERWIQGEAESWDEAGVAPQLLVLWSIDQNDLVPIDGWLHKLAADNEKYGMRIVSIAQAWDARKLKDYLAEHPFPGIVGVDEEPPSGTGPTFEAFGIERFGLPRLVLLDIDGKVAWEGDPGFKAGQPYDPSVEGYLEAPLADLLERRQLLDLVAWRDQWQSVALPAIAKGDVPTAIPTLLASMDFDWRIDDLVLEAQRRKKAIENALVSIDSTVEELVAAGQEPALAVLLEWSEHFALEKSPTKNRAVKKALKAKNAKDWQKAVGVVNATMKKVDAGKEVAIDDMLRRLSVLDGPLAETLRQDLEAGAADPVALEATLRSAEALPTKWLIEEYFGWKD